MSNGSTVNISGNGIIIDCVQLCQDIFHALEYIEQHVSISLTRSSLSVLLNARPIVLLASINRVQSDQKFHSLPE